MAQGNLLITPKRVVFEDSKRFQELNLANTGKDTAKYQISFLQIRMKEDGSFEKITEADSGQYFADKYLRVFPRTVTLAPNEAQVVKIQLTKTANLTAGEYRSHLHFRSIPNVAPLGEKGVLRDSVAGVSIRLMPVFGITVPVIIRVGENTSKVSLSALSVNLEPKSKPVLSLSLNRSGSMSVYGDLTVNHIAKSGKVTQVGLIKGISVYTPNTQRKVKVTLDGNAGTDFKDGKLQVVYTQETGLNTEKLGEAEMILH